MDLHMKLARESSGMPYFSGTESEVERISHMLSSRRSSRTNLLAHEGAADDGADAVDSDEEAGVTSHPFKNVKVVVLVGGPQDDNIFRPLSLKTPPPLFPIASVPHVLHHIRIAARVANVSEIVILGQYSPKKFQDISIMATRETGIPVHYLQEYTRLGTAGGLYHFRDLILRGDPDAFVLLHSDICCDFPMDDLLAFHGKHAPKAVMSIMGVKATEDQSPQYGVIHVDEDDDVSVVHYVEKPKTDRSNTVNGGLYAFSPALFDSLKEVYLKKHKGMDISSTAKLTFEHDIFPSLIEHTSNGIQSKLYVHQCDIFWTQVKAAASAVYANRYYLDLFRNISPSILADASINEAGQSPEIVGDVIIDATARVHPSAKIGPNVSIGPFCVIGEGVRVKDSIVLSNVHLQSNSCVLNSIVGWNTVVGEWGRVEGDKVGPDPNDPTTHIRQKQLFNEDGKLEPNVTVLGEGVRVSDGVHVLNTLCLPHHAIKLSKANQILL